MRVVSHCSGWLAESQALRKLKVAHRLVMASDINPAVKKLALANHTIDWWLDDMTTLPVESMPVADLYVCGFPCQPFSNAGQNKGTQDSRSHPIATVMGYIEAKLPSIAVLENVEGFVKRHAKTFKRLLKFFEGLGQYDVHHTILNTFDYGVPQNRKRLYIVLIKKRLHRLPFKWPTPVKCPPLTKFWDRHGHTIAKSATIDKGIVAAATSGACLEKAYGEIYDMYGSPKKVDAIIDIGCSTGFFHNGELEQLQHSQRLVVGPWAISPALCSVACPSRS